MNQGLPTAAGYTPPPLADESAQIFSPTQLDQPFEADLENMAPPALALTEMLETYSQCLALSRDYVEESLKGASVDDVDEDRLSQFLSARAELFEVAENSFTALASCLSEDSSSGGESQRELTGKVLAILEEMTALENQLTSFLGDRLHKMRETINMMKRSQPVFQRYSTLGTTKIEPLHITRHG